LSIELYKILNFLGVRSPIRLF